MIIFPQNIHNSDTSHLTLKGEFIIAHAIVTLFVISHYDVL